MRRLHTLIKMRNFVKGRGYLQQNIHIIDFALYMAKHMFLSQILAQLKIL